DIGVIRDSTNSAERQVLSAKRLLRQIGLKISPEKSKAIIIKKGKLQEGTLVIDQDTIITGLKENETVKYLGMTFDSQLVFDEASVIKDLSTSLNKLSNSPLLTPEQKLNIVNQYIWPTLIYPLQTAPLSKLTNQFLEDVDLLVRSAVKEILSLPGDTPNAFIYANRK